MILAFIKKHARAEKVEFIKYQGRWRYNISQDENVTLAYISENATDLILKRWIMEPMVIGSKVYEKHASAFLEQ